jgi:hypothetical protein
MLPNRSLRSALSLTTVILLAPTALFAQQFAPSGQAPAAVAAPATAPVMEQNFTRAPTGKSAQDLMADRAEKLNGEATMRGKDDEIYASGFFETFAKDPIELAKARDDFAQIAWLTAQGQLINSIYSTFEASSVFEMPGNPLDSRFKTQRDTLEKQMRDLQARIRDATNSVDQATAAEIQNKMSGVDGVKFVDRANALLNAVITAIDDKYSAERLAQQKDAEIQRKAATLEAIKKEAKAGLDALQQQLDRLNDELREELAKVNASLTTDVKRSSSMPLMGATVVDMAESLIDGKYQVAIVMKWSKKNEKFARAILTGQALKDDPAPGRSLPDWLGKIDRGTIAGSRVFTDENGDRWFIGIGSYPTLKGGVQSTVAQTAASLKSDRALMFSLVANAAAHEQLSGQTNISGSAGKEEFESMLSVQKNLSAKIEKTAIPNKRVLVNRTAMNDITGQEVWVVVTAVNATSSQRALDDLRKSFANVIDVTRYQAGIQGQLQGMRDAQGAAAAQSQSISTNAAARERQQLLTPAAPPASTAAPAPTVAPDGGLLDGAVATGRRAPGGVRTGGGYSDD